MGIKQGGLAGAGVAADEEQSAAAEPGKIQLGAPGVGGRRRRASGTGVSCFGGLLSQLLDGPGLLNGQGAAVHLGEKVLEQLGKGLAPHGQRRVGGPCRGAPGLVVQPHGVGVGGPQGGHGVGQRRGGR